MEIEEGGGPAETTEPSAPKPGETWRRARAALEGGDFTQAVTLFEAAVAETPGNPKILMGLGRALRETGRPADAEAAYRRLIELEPANVTARMAVGRAAAERGDFEDAVVNLSAARAEEPDNTKILTLLGRALRESQRPVEAEAVYRRLLEIEPANVAAQMAVGRTAWEQGRRSEALVHLRAAAAAGGPADPRRDLSIGEKFLAQMQIDEAAAAFRRVLAAHPDNAAALKGLGRCAQVSGDDEEALAKYRAATAHEPGNPWLQTEIRRIEAKQGGDDWKSELGDAIAISNAADSTREDRLWSAHILVAYGMTGQVEKALAPLEKTGPVRRLLQIAHQLGRMGLSQPAVAPGEGVGPEAELFGGLSGFVEQLNPGSEALVLVFTGVANRAFLSMDMMHRVLRTTGASVLYLRDLQRTRYLAGVVGLGEDFASTAESFRTIMARSGASRMLMIGHCGGCAGALRFGLALGAEAVLAVAPRIIDAAILDGLSGRGAAKRDALRKSAGPFAGDLPSLYSAAESAPRVTLIAAKDVEPEASFARDMTARVPGVISVEMPGALKGSLGDILALGLLSPLISSFVESGGVSPDILEGLIRPASDEAAVASSLQG
ncbi:MAG: tetratricopeptide repeat protein [Caulobacteraceae bacterium]